MNPEHYKVRIDGRRVVVAVAREDTIRRISTNLVALGASPVGPGAWVCDINIPTIDLASAVGELADGEVVYLSTNGDFGFLVAPKTDGGIIVTPR